MTNLTLSGNPRYQPKDLIDVFGYDNIAKYLVSVELAAFYTLMEMGSIKKEDYALYTNEVKQKLMSITTTEIDKVEREITKHDIRALVRIMQEIMPEPLRRFVHIPLTSYDVIDTARALQFKDAHLKVVRPKLKSIITILKKHTWDYSTQIQIGRTHGQHALPVTVGFWFATILNRVLHNAKQMDIYADGLVGKISGAVGAYNAQIGLGIVNTPCTSFEKRVLERLG